MKDKGYMAIMVVYLSLLLCGILWQVITLDAKIKLLQEQAELLQARMGQNLGMITILDEREDEDCLIFSGQMNEDGLIEIKKVGAINK